MNSKIIILDDEENFAEMIQEILHEAGFRAEVQTSPRATLNLLKDGAYDLVVADFKMPEMDGDEFLTQARKIRPDLPIIMISGMMNTPELVRVANMGVTLVLEKPVDPRQLIQCVGRFAKPMRKESDLPAGGLAAEKPLSPGQGGAFPQPLRFLVAESAVMRSFLQGLWQASEDSLLAVRVPHGSESDLLGREISLWKGGDAASVPCLSWDWVHRFGFRDASDYQPASALPPPVILIDATFQADRSPSDPPTSWTVGSEPLLNAFRAQFPSALGLLLLPPSGLTPPVGLRQFQFPALVDRTADIGRLLISFQLENRRNPVSCSPEALRLLLHHEWPDNFRELRACALEMTRIGGTQPLSFAQVAAILRHRHASLPETPCELSARHWLERAQARFFIRHNASELDELLREAEIPQVLIQAQKPLTAQPLLCPELLPANHEPAT